jgi:Flp pilus assembly protein TadB
VIVLLVLLPFYFEEGQATQKPKEKDRMTSNTMTKRKGQKDKQHNGQKKRTEGQATQWPKEKNRRKSNTMTKENAFGHCVACPSVLFFWPLCCLSFCPFLLAILLLVLLSFSFGH